MHSSKFGFRGERLTDKGVFILANTAVKRADGSLQFPKVQLQHNAIAKPENLAGVLDGKMSAELLTPWTHAEASCGISKNAASLLPCLIFL